MFELGLGWLAGKVNIGCSSSSLPACMLSPGLCFWVQTAREVLSAVPSVLVAEVAAPGWVFFRSSQLSCTELYDELAAGGIILSGPHKLGEHRLVN
jgi:hypothetical protein